MQIKIANVLGVANADLDLTPGRIATVSGLNRAGKTSLSTAVGAALCHDANPLGAARNVGKIYLRDNADTGEVEISEGGEPIIKWQVATGDMAHFAQAEEVTPSTPGPVGLIEFCAGMTAPARTALWEGYFLPPVEELRALIERQLKPHLADRTLNEVMEKIDAGDMTEVVKAYEQRARDAKAAWMAITGDQWGPRKGADWLPDGWAAHLDGHTPESAVKEWQEAKDGLTGFNIAHAVSAADVARAKDAAARIPEARKIAEVTDKTLTEAEKAYDEVYGQLQGIVRSIPNAKTDLERLKARKPVEDRFLVCPRVPDAVGGPGSWPGSGEARAHRHRPAGRAVGGLDRDGGRPDRGYGGRPGNGRGKRGAASSVRGRRGRGEP